MILRLDHINVRTANLAGLVQFYTEVLGMSEGERPPLGFSGAWLYAGGAPVIHLVEVAEPPKPEGALRLEHFAFAATGLAELITRLHAQGVDFRESRQPGTGNVIINMHDPDGNRLHLDFPATEAG
ncbi:MAG: glyoxalase [Myxococcales bacterium]|nr:MAG: glyoxalase [Myxococcales bacterium]